MQTKTCSECHKTKPLSEFYKEVTGKFGVRADCKDCRREYYAKYFPLYRSRKAWQRVMGR